MATSILQVNNLEFLNSSLQSLAKLTATANILTLSSLAGSVELKNLSTPTTDTSAATKSYVDSVTQGLSFKNSVRVATTTAEIGSPWTLSSSFANGQTVDGITLNTGDRILIKNQSSAIENGIYVVAASGAPARASDLASSFSAKGSAVFVEEGSVNSDTAFVCTNDSGSDVVGTDGLTFTQFSGLGQIIAGEALSKTGNQLDINVDDSTIEVSGDALQVKDSGITNSKLANSSLSVVAGYGLYTTSESISLGGTATLNVTVDGSSIEIGPDHSLQVKALGITNAMLAGSIENAKLTNSSVTVTAGDGLQTGGSVSLGGTVTLDVNSTVVRTTGAQSIAGVKTFSDTTQATSSTAAGTVFSGGLGIAKDVRCDGSIYGTSHISTSDARLKTVVDEVKDAHEIIMKLKPVSYKWKDGRDTHTHVGLLAQDVKEVFPDAVRTDSNGYLAVDYTSLFMLLLKAYQER